MKRLSIISLLATLPLAMFAYYDDYNPEPSGFIKFLMFILLVWGILEVILFFKVWRMANDVNKIKNNILRTNTPQLLRKYRLLGQNDKAADVLIQDFFDLMQKKMQTQYYDKSIEDDVAELEFGLSQLGVKLPEEFKKLKVVGDYNKLGHMKTLVRAKYEEQQAAKQKEEQSSEN